MGIQFFVFLLFSLISSVASIECFACDHVKTVAECKTYETCNTGQVCFTDYLHSGNETFLSFGCRLEASCREIVATKNGTIVGAGTLVGRSLPSLQCSQCCVEHHCNRQLCQQSFSVEECSDSSYINCPVLEQLANICADTQRANSVCRRSCGLCKYVDGHWAEWSNWSTCDVICGHWRQTRSRTCSESAISKSDPPCPGSSTESRTCSLQFHQVPDCLPGEMCVDLNEKGKVTNHLTGVDTLTPPTGLQGGKECSRQATFKVTFDQLPSNSTSLCHTDTYTQRRMLKVQMYFSDTYRYGWMFNIGDSASNNGWAGDSGDTEYEAELQALGTGVSMYASNVLDCRARLLHQYPGATNTSASKLNVWIANHYFKVANDNGLCESDCDKCLYELNGLDTSGGRSNQEIYIAANRVVSGSYRNGYGLCFMKMSWVSGPEA